MPDSLFALALLACPVGMAAMMWMMNRNHGTQPADGNQATRKAELAALQAQVDQLQAAQRGQTRGGTTSDSSLQPLAAPAAEVTAPSDIRGRP